MTYVARRWRRICHLLFTKTIEKMLIYTFLVFYMLLSLFNYPVEISGEVNMLVEDTERASSLPSCPEVPTGLVGNIHVNTESVPSILNLSRAFSHIQMGGTHSPRDCEARQRLAVIIPYRNRENHLKILLKYLHTILQHQRRDYTIFVAEQTANTVWNKGRLYNKAIDTISRMSRNFSCFVFHDVDLIPEDDRNLYECYTMPYHLSVAIDKFRYLLPYRNLVGGCLAMSRGQVRRINGYSNEFWGWGGEDDDLAMRIAEAGYDIARPASYIARYKMITHAANPVVNPIRYKLLQYRKQFPHGGLGNIHKTDCKIVSIIKESLFTTLLIDVGQQSGEHHKLVTQLSSRNMPRKMGLIDYVKHLLGFDIQEFYS